MSPQTTIPCTINGKISLVVISKINNYLFDSIVRTGLD